MKTTKQYLRKIIQEEMGTHVFKPVLLDTVLNEISGKDVICEAQERWAYVVLREGVRDVLDEARELHLLIEAGTTVGDVLSQFDDTASDLDNKVMEFVKTAMDFVKPFAAGAIIEAGGPDAEEDDIESIVKYFSEIKDMFADVIKAIKKAGESVKEQVKAFFKEGGTKILEAFSNVKELYESSELAKKIFKAVGGEAIKKTVMKIVDKIAPLIPFGGQVLAAAKMIKGAISIGGKLKSLVSKFKKSKASPQEKFAAFAEKIARGPDNDELGELASILQMNDDIEDILDDKVEVQFVKFYVEHLRGMDESKPIESININTMLTDWIKDELGAKTADVTVTS